MVSRTKDLLLYLLLLGVSVLCNAAPMVEQEYRIEAFQRDGDSQSLILRIQPRGTTGSSSVSRQGRQEDEDDDDGPTSAPVPSSTPFIPAVIPALTKIFAGIITGNLNSIVHGSTSFAPQNISYAIDTVYNQVVGIAAPISTQKPTRAAPTTTPEPEVVTSLSPASSVAETASKASPPSVAAGQPLGGQSLIITTAQTTSKPAVTTVSEDDEDESDVDPDFKI